MNQKTALKQLKFLETKSSFMRLASQGWQNDFQTLIAILLSARTRDETTIKICQELFKNYPDTKKLSLAKLNEIEKIIRPVNFYKNKSKNILNLSKILVKDYNSKIPDKIEELILLPGIGRKTANVYLSQKGKNAIGVDTHVSYISQKLGWTKNKNSHKIEEDLENLFSKKDWSKVNTILVSFGKTYNSRKKQDEILEEIKRE
ncbi:MAG: Endonuclease III [archaeon GW2011_AR13]|nr:MAG: Endonuclease III [archaeon GW2011_AR13]HIG94423.1 endonuclease III [Nanoarchaeota archaeon]HIH62933.1 endonuclease III [Nanoarchaeota archaeon]HIJ10370.1 endonuclease III [Nanoarchaeota archaeon]